jgi:predicted HTH transcriptional regulator
MDLQELIIRGRFLFSSAPSRLHVFNQVNGRRTATEIAKMLRRHVNNIHRDLKSLSDAGLLQPKRGEDGEPFKKDGYTVYEKIPLARTIPVTYFKTSIRHPVRPSKRNSTKRRMVERRPKPLGVPTENEMLDICRKGEDQVHEFKARGTDIRKITHETGAMLNTRQGGLIFYGIEDSGRVQGVDLARQDFDQRLQNSVRNSIAPAATVELRPITVLRSEVFVIIVPPWNRGDVYQFDEKVLIRKGTNAFAAKPEELRRLHRGEYVV